MLWQKHFGGVSNEFLIAAVEIPGGGFLLGGYSDSPPGPNKTSAAYGYFDYWLVRTDAQGEKIWERSFGGDQDDHLTDLELTSDGGFLVAGTSLSEVSGNKTVAGFGKRDYWVLRLNGNGDAIWQRSYGGDDSEFLQDLVQTPDGGFLLAGYSFSAANGTKTTPPEGLFDYWIVRIEADGDVLWDAGFGGSSFDYLSRASMATNEGFLLAGYSSSGMTGTKTTPNIGDLDYWIILTDSNGVEVSQFVYGGEEDDIPLALVRADDGGFYVGGDSVSDTTGTKTSENLGRDDFWVVRMDANGQAMWDRSFGSTSQDVIRSMTRLGSDSVVLAGWSSSPIGGTKSSEPYGKSDFWISGIDEGGTQVYNQAWGGNEDEVVLSILECADGDLLLGGYSFSGMEGYKTVPSHGLSDYWIIKVSVDQVPAFEPPELDYFAQSSADVMALGYRFKLLGQTHRCYTSERSGDLITWTAFTTNVLESPEMELADPDATPGQPRYYRARVRP